MKTRRTSQKLLNGQRERRSRRSRAVAAEVLEARYLLAFDVEVVIDPPEQLSADAMFGKAVDMDGGFAVIGAPRDGSNSGAVYLADLQNPLNPAKRLPSPPTLKEGDHFGNAVAIQGNTVVIGALASDNSAGAVYVYTRTDGQRTANQTCSDIVASNETIRADWDVDWDACDWRIERLVASDGHYGATLGFSVAIDGDWIIAGAPFAKTDGAMSGAVYAFERQSNTAPWPTTETQRLVAGDGSFGDEFGHAVGLSGDRLAVSAVRDDDAGKDSGSVYTFQRRSPWFFEHKFSNPASQDGGCFGVSIAMGSNTMTIGSPLHDNDPDSGTAYVYVFETDGSARRENYPPESAEAGGRYGESVAIGENNNGSDLLLIGAPLRDANGVDSGIAFITEMSDGNMLSGPYEVVGDSSDGAHLGLSVAITTDRGDGSRVAAAGRPGDNAVSLFFDDADVAIRHVPTGDAVEGTDFTFSFELENFGPGPGIGVQTEYTIPPELDFVSASVGCAQEVADSQTVVCANNIDLGATATHEITVQVPADELDRRSELTFTGEISEDDTISHDPNTANNRAEFTTDIVSQPDLTITKTDNYSDAQFARAGQDEIDYVIDVINLGPSSARGVYIQEFLPESLLDEDISADNCNLDATRQRCDLRRTLAPGERERVTISVAPGADDGYEGIPTQIVVDGNLGDVITLSNVAEVRTDHPATTDPNSSNNTSDPAEVHVAPIVDIGVSLVASDPVVAGRNMSYTATITNAGPSTARNVTAEVTIPSNFTNATPSFPNSNGTCTSEQNTLSCDMGDLGPNTSATFTISADVPPDATGSAAARIEATSDANEATGLGSLPNEAESTTQIEIVAPLEVVAMQPRGDGDAPVTMAVAGASAPVDFSATILVHPWRETCLSWQCRMMAYCSWETIVRVESLGRASRLGVRW